jgi:hypothetical protein
MRGTAVGGVRARLRLPTHSSWVVIGSAAVVLLFFLSSAFGSIVTSSNAPLVPPFSGATKTVYFSNTTTGCGALPILAPHSLNMSNGHLQFRAESIAPNCTGNRSAAAILEYTVKIPVTPASANSSIRVNWTVISNLSATLVLGKCKFYGVPPGPECGQEAIAQIGITPWLQDLGSRTSTYGKAWIGGFYFHRTNPCRPPSCPSPGNGGSGFVHVDQNLSLWVNATGLNLNHHYDLEILFTVTVAVGFGGSSATILGGHASASVNLHTKGSGAWLDSVTLG